MTLEEMEKKIINLEIKVQVNAIVMVFMFISLLIFITLLNLDAKRNTEAEILKAIKEFKENNKHDENL